MTEKSPIPVPWKLLIKRAQYQLVPPGDHRRVRFAHSELFEQLTHLTVGFKVEPCERHAVLSQEFANPVRVARVARANHAQPCEVA